jgi:hypothetical protein
LTYRILRGLVHNPLSPQTPKDNWEKNTDKSCKIKVLQDLSVCMKDTWKTAKHTLQRKSRQDEAFERNARIEVNLLRPLNGKSEMKWKVSARWTESLKWNEKHSPVERNAWNERHQLLCGFLQGCVGEVEERYKAFFILAVSGLNFFWTVNCFSEKLRLKLNGTSLCNSPLFCNFAVYCNAWWLKSWT